MKQGRAGRREEIREGRREEKRQGEKQAMGREGEGGSDAQFGFPGALHLAVKFKVILSIVGAGEGGDVSRHVDLGRVGGREGGREGGRNQTDNQTEFCMQCSQPLLPRVSAREAVLSFWIQPGDHLPVTLSSGTPLGGITASSS